MQHPKSSDVLKIVKNFESILHLATRKGHLNMRCGYVNDYTVHQCGTTHCHGGWYAIAAGLHKKAVIDFTHGADQMAKDLGFDNYGELEFWAKINPTIWENECGVFMFCQTGQYAFLSIKRPLGAQNLQDIIDHWKEVAGRLEEMENPYPNITKELAVLPVEEKSDVNVKSIRFVY